MINGRQHRHGRMASPCWPTGVQDHGMYAQGTHANVGDPYTSAAADSGAVGRRAKCSQAAWMYALDEQAERTTSALRRYCRAQAPQEGCAGVGAPEYDLGSRGTVACGTRWRKGGCRV